MTFTTIPKNNQTKDAPHPTNNHPLPCEVNKEIKPKRTPTSKQKNQNQAKKKSQQWLTQNPPNKPKPSKKEKQGRKANIDSHKTPQQTKTTLLKKRGKKPHSRNVTSSPTQNFLGNIMKLLSWKTFFLCLKNPAPQRWRFVDRMKECSLMVYQCIGHLDVTMLSHCCLLQLASLLQSKGVLRTLKTCLIRTS